MKKSFFILSGLISLLVLNQELYAFGVEPARIELSIPAGRQKGKMVTIDNSKSDEPLHIKAYVQDIMYLPDGTINFPASGTTEWSCANWVSIIPDEVDIPAGKTQAVRITVSMPIEAKGGYYAVVFFESSPTHIQGLGINFRLGVLLDLGVTNTEIRKAQLVNIFFLKPKQIEVDIFNEGNVLIRPKGSIKILGAQGKRIKQLDFNSQRLGVLPKTLRKFYLELIEPLNAGKYRLKAEVDYGTKYLLVGELPIEIE
jgi:hypothetical protein